ncbi:hypothetical protein [Bacillus thuringiensis]|uniref:hypothetical protein n=1 Tax=Bacillus thuringiensis TaxID=1428 RepID=UPI000BFBE73B|nr:hypothetical protein [Bacillus thuringiensis]PGT90112.1 hypothetical protein COD17_10200 [Bacillus thuringiensis]
MGVETSSKPKVLVFGDLRLEDVAVELMQRRKDVKWLASAVTSYEYIETGNSQPKKDTEQVEKEEDIQEVVNNGHGLVVVSEVTQIANDWLRKILRKPVTGEEKTIVVVGGANKRIWNKVFGHLRKHHVDPKDVQWFVTIGVLDMPNKLRKGNNAVEIDLCVALEPVLDYVNHVIHVYHDCIGDMVAVRDEGTDAEDTDRQEEKPTAQDVHTPALELLMKKMSGGLGFDFSFGEMLPNGMIQVTDQEEAHEMLDSFVTAGGGMVLTGNSPVLMEKQLVKYIPKDDGLGAMLGADVDIERFYQTYNDVPCMSVVVEEVEIRVNVKEKLSVQKCLPFTNALDGVKDVCSHVSALQVDSAEYWSLMYVWGEKFVEKGASVKGGILTISLEEYKEAVEHAKHRLYELRGRMSQPPADIVGALESMVAVVGDDGQLESIGLPAIVLYKFLYEKE